MLRLKGLRHGDIAGVGVLGLREAKVCTDLEGNVVTALSGGGLVQEDDLSVGILVLGGPIVGKLIKLIINIISEYSSFQEALTYSTGPPFLYSYLSLVRIRIQLP
jgi:hypothetical protein